MVTKSNFDLIVALCESRQELVQAGIFISLYELTQGHLDNAYHTIGACSRIAYLLRLHQLSDYGNAIDTVNAIPNLETIPTWWGVMIMDR
jgi:hypothetical protein